MYKKILLIDDDEDEQKAQNDAHQQAWYIFSYALSVKETAW